MDTFTWSLRPFSWNTAERIAEDLALPLTVAVILARRGFRDADEVRAFLDTSEVVPDPFLFSDMDEAVQRL